MGFLLGSGGTHGNKISLQMQANSVVRLGKPATAVGHPEPLASTIVIAL
jgi:hypothetical protein